MSGRDSGRTLRMVRNIPASGALVIVHNDPMRQYVRTMIADVRGSDLLKVCTVSAVRNRADAHRLLLGRRGHVAIDHAFDEIAAADVCDLVHRLVDGIRAVTAA